MRQTIFDFKLARHTLIALIVVGSAIRAFICFSQNPMGFLFSDPARHWDNGIRFFNPSYIGAGDPILFQVYIFILQLVSQQNRYIVAGFCAVLSIIMPWTYYRAAREFNLSKNESLTAWVLIAWNPSLSVIYHYIMMETLLLVLVGLGLWSTGRCLRLRTDGAWLLTTALWTLAVFTKVTIIPVAIICIACIWWTSTTRILWAMSAICLVTLMLIPNGIRSRKYLGFTAPLGNTIMQELVHRADTRGIQIDIGNGRYVFSSPSAYIHPLEPLSAWMIRRAYSNSSLLVVVNPARGAIDWQNASNNLHIGASERFRELLENMVLFLFAPSWPDSDKGTWNGWINYQARWMWAPLIFFVLDCNLREFMKRQIRVLPLAVTGLTLFLAFQNMSTMEGRIRKPLEPLLLLNLVWIFRRDLSLNSI